MPSCRLLGRLASARKPVGKHGCVSMCERYLVWRAVCVSGMFTGCQADIPALNQGLQYVLAHLQIALKEGTILQILSTISEHT